MCNSELINKSPICASTSSCPRDLDFPMKTFSRIIKGRAFLVSSNMSWICLQVFLLLDSLRPVSKETSRRHLDVRSSGSILSCSKQPKPGTGVLPPEGPSPAGVTTEICCIVILAKAVGGALDVSSNRHFRTLKKLKCSSSRSLKERQLIRHPTSNRCCC